MPKERMRQLLIKQTISPIAQAIVNFGLVHNCPQFVASDTWLKNSLTGNMQTKERYSNNRINQRTQGYYHFLTSIIRKINSQPMFINPM